MIRHFPAELWFILGSFCTIYNEIKSLIDNPLPTPLAHLAISVGFICLLNWKGFIIE